jgi:uncharacterized protein (TIGR02646 family)
MRGSAKGCEPEELRVWKDLQLENGIELEYRALPRLERDSMVSSLYAEQTGQCVYCGRGISLARHESYHVEHFRPQWKYRALQLDYENLFLSCDVEGDRRGRQTCGNHKENWFEEDCHIPPAPESCAERLRFRSSGDIVGDHSVEAEKMIEVLNLNHRELVTSRQALIESLDQELNGGVPEEDLLQSYLDTNRHGARPSFANVAIGYLKRVIDTTFSSDRSSG